MARLSLEPGLPSFETLFAGASVQQALCPKPLHHFLGPLSGSGASPGWGGERRWWTPTCCDALPGYIRARPTDTHISGCLQVVAGAEPRSSSWEAGSLSSFTLLPSRGWGSWGMGGGLGAVSFCILFNSELPTAPPC